MDLSINIKNTLLALCNLKSTTGTTEEAIAAQGIHDIISEIGYFKSNKDNLIARKIQNDPLGRKVVSALYETGKSKKTVVLLSHFDVVGVEEFGHLKKYAYSPVEYTEKLKDEKLPENIKSHLDSGDWLFGRGTMDMKCGLAIHIELIRYVYENNIDIDGNILLITVPDEENNSAGMLEAVNYLSELKDRGYDLRGVINSEPNIGESPGDDSRYIYTGTIGKLLPFIFFAGVETHAGDPFGGISSSLLSSITTSLIDANPDLCDILGDTVAPPPVCLKQEDLKYLYNVSTPSYSYAYYNYMTLTSSPGDVMDKIKEICNEAFEIAIDKMIKGRYKYYKLSDMTAPEYSITPNILTYSELVKLLEEKNVNIDTLKEKYAGDTRDARELTSHLISDMVKYLPELRPLMVLSFAPPYYPHKTAKGNFKEILDVCSSVMYRSEYLFKERLIPKDFYFGLCDLSYLGFDNPEGYYALESNMPMFGTAYSLPTKALSNINIGGMNIGTVGEDAHKYTERLYTPYSFNTTPDLVLFAIKEFLSK